MENESLNLIKNLTPKLVYDSSTMLNNKFQGDEYINFLKVLPNSDEFLIITNNNFLITI